MKQTQIIIDNIPTDLMIALRMSAIHNGDVNDVPKVALEILINYYKLRQKD